MCRIPGFLLAIPLLLTLVCGCSGNNDPVIPGPSNHPLSPDLQTSSGTQTNRYVWGIWDVKINPDLQTVQIIPRRTAGMHLNCVRLLEVEPCTYCLGIEILEVSDSPKKLKADVSLTHPYPGNHKLTAFDVRGIFITNADYLFPVNGRTMAWSGINNPVLLNPDGYTPLFNPSEFPETLPGPPALKYFPGKWSTGEDLTANLNPFVAYARTATRRLFFAGGGATRTVNVLCPDGPLEFGYAVDACWTLVEGEIIDPLVDFPPEANCLEAYRIDVELEPLDDNPGSTAPIQIEVFDHQGSDTIASVTIEAPEIFTGEVSLNYTGTSGDESWLYSGTLTNSLASAGQYPLLVKVTDTEPDPNLGPVDAYQVYNVTVSGEVSHGRVFIWDGELSKYVWGSSVDPSGNIFVTGRFSRNIDLDPGPFADWRETLGALWTDIFLVKLDPDGNYLWGHSFGNPGHNTRVYDVVADSYGDVYAAGQYFGIMDFDPGPAVDEHTGNGDWDVWISKFSSAGEHVWTRTWGGIGGEVPRDIDVSGNSVFVGGDFDSDNVDFDPGPGTDMHYTEGGPTGFLSKINLNGDYQWARTWGGYGSGVYTQGTATDSSGAIYLAGYFFGTVDFDPGTGVDQRSTNGGPDDYSSFLSKISVNGYHQWVRTWGGTGSDRAIALSCDDFGNCYLTGFFDGTDDFDPGPGVYDLNASFGILFLTGFNSSGEHQWACNWGNVETEVDGVAADGQGGVYVTGNFQNTVDLDPGPGVSEHTSNGMRDFWLSKFSSGGAFLWDAAWGGEQGHRPYSLDADNSGFCYVGGAFGKLVDFDPGPGTEWHYASDHGSAFLSVFPPDGYW